MKNAKGVYTRCRLHGGNSTGPRTPEGLERRRRANWKHGRHSAGARESRLYFKAKSRLLLTGIKALRLEMKWVRRMQRRERSPEGGSGAA
jgi:hypothetical protein